MGEILKDAFKPFSEETACIRIRHTVSNRYRTGSALPLSRKWGSHVIGPVDEIKNVKNADF